MSLKVSEIKDKAKELKEEIAEILSHIELNYWFRVLVDNNSGVCLEINIDNTKVYSKNKINVIVMKKFINDMNELDIDEDNAHYIRLRMDDIVVRNYDESIQLQYFGRETLEKIQVAKLRYRMEQAE